MHIVKTLLVLVFSILCVSCATVFKGYEDNVTIFGASENLKIKTQDGIELKVEKVNEYYSPPAKKGGLVIEAHMMKIPNNKDYILSITDDGQNYKIYLNRKLGFGWFALDVILFVIPAIYDGIAGTWYYFDDIDLNLIKQN